MHRFLVALAHFDEVPRQFLGLLVPMLDVIREVPAMPPQGVRVFIERFQQLQDFRQLLLAELLAVGEVLESHFLRPDLNQDPVQLRVVIHVLDSLFARDRIQRRLRNVNETLFNQLRHLPVKER